MIEALRPELTGDGLRGVTATILGSDTSIVERFLPGVDEDTIVVEHAREPSRGRVVIGAIVGTVLGALGGLFFVRARKQTRADHEAIAQWQASQTRHGTQYPPNGGAPADSTTDLRPPPT